MSPEFGTPDTHKIYSMDTRLVGYIAGGILTSLLREPNAAPSFSAIRPTLFAAAASLPTSTKSDKSLKKKGTD